jgi:hypothetical protein
LEGGIFTEDSDSLEGEHLSLYRGSVRGTWREGSLTEDLKRRVIEGSGKGEFFRGAP